MKARVSLNHICNGTIYSHDGFFFAGNVWVCTHTLSEKVVNTWRWSVCPRWRHFAGVQKTGLQVRQIKYILFLVDDINCDIKVLWVISSMITVTNIDYNVDSLRAEYGRVLYSWCCLTFSFLRVFGFQSLLTVLALNQL